MRVVTGQAHHLQTVAQGFRDFGFVIRRCNKQHAAKVEAHFHKVVGKVVVLLGVQNFEHGAGGVTAEVACHLVDFIEQDNRVHALCTAQRLNESARHSTNVGTAVSTNFGFVTDATERNANKVTLHGIRNGFHEGRLAHARRTHQAKNRSTAFGSREFQDRHVFHDAFLHLVETEVLGIEFALYLFHVEDRIGVLTIRQVQEPIQIVTAYSVFRRRRLHQLHAANFFFEFFLNRLRELFRLDFLEQLIRFRSIPILTIEFVLQLANLFGNEPFLLLLRHLLANILLYLDHHGVGIGSHLHNFDQAFREFIDFAYFKQTLTFFHRNLQEGNHAVKSVNLAIHGEQRVHHAFRNVPMQGIFLELGQDRFEARSLAGIRNGGLVLRHRDHQKIVLSRNGAEIHHAFPIEHYLHATVRERSHITHLRKDTHRIQVKHRVLDFFLFDILLSRKDNLSIVGFSIFKSAQRNIPTDKNAAGRVRKYNGIPQREQGVHFRSV